MTSGPPCTSRSRWNDRLDNDYLHNAELSASDHGVCCVLPMSVHLISLDVAATVGWRRVLPC